MDDDLALAVDIAPFAINRNTGQALPKRAIPAPFTAKQYPITAAPDGSI
jgi:hypothetical protein